MLSVRSKCLHNGLSDRPPVDRAQQRGAEKIGPTGARPGDVPQAFRDLGLIGAVVNLDRQLG
jgi:hypothetical protein